MPIGPAQNGVQGFEQRLNDTSRRVGGATFAPTDIESENQHRRDTLHSAEALLKEVGESSRQ